MKSDLNKNISIHLFKIRPEVRYIVRLIDILLDADSSWPFYLPKDQITDEVQDYYKNKWTLLFCESLDEDELVAIARSRFIA